MPLRLWFSYTVLDFRIHMSPWAHMCACVLRFCNFSPDLPNGRVLRGVTPRSSLVILGATLRHVVFSSHRALRAHALSESGGGGEDGEMSGFLRDETEAGQPASVPADCFSTRAGDVSVRPVFYHRAL